MPTLAEIASWIDAQPLPEGAGDLQINGIGPSDAAEPGQITFVTEARYLSHLARTPATAAVVAAELANGVRKNEGLILLPVANPSLALEITLQHFARPVPRPVTGISPAASVDPTASLGKDLRIGPGVVVGRNVTLGHRTVLHPGVAISDDVTIGDDCELFPNVVVREHCTIGHRVIIHANSVIGTDGFGYRWNGSRHVKQPHIGTVVIEDDVEIGSGTCIDRGKIAETRIGAGTKIDNLVQVGHNVIMGRHCILCANVGIAGTVTLGDGVVLGGGVGVRDHVRIGSGVMAAGYAGIHNDLPAGQVVAGFPAVERRAFMREQATLRRLPDLFRRLRELKQRVEAVEARKP